MEGSKAGDVYINIRARGDATEEEMDYVALTLAPRDYRVLELKPLLIKLLNLEDQLPRDKTTSAPRLESFKLFKGTSKDAFLPSQVVKIVGDEVFEYTIVGGGAKENDALKKRKIEEPKQKEVEGKKEELVKESEDKAELPLEDRVTQILDKIKHNFNQPDVLISCCSAIVELTRKENKSRLLFGREGIQSVITVLRTYPFDSNIQDVGIHALYAIACYTEPNKVIVEELKGVELVLDTMKQHKGVAKIQSRACAMIWVMAFNNQKIQTIIAQAKGIEMIVSGMLCDMTDPELQAYGCAALWNVCFKNEANKKVVARCGLAVIIAAMRRFPKDKSIISYACGALNAVCATQTAQNHINLARLAGAREVLQAAQKEFGADQSIKTNATSVLNCVEKVFKDLNWMSS